MRHRMKSPKQLAGHNIKSPNILLKSRHHDDVIEDCRPGCGGAKFSLRTARQSHAPSLAKLLDDLAVFWIQRVKILSGAKQNTLTCEKISRPVDQPAKCRTAPAFRLEPPQFTTVFRIDKIGRAHV